MFIKYLIRIYSMDKNNFTKNKREKENITIKLWIQPSFINSSSVPHLPLPFARRPSFCSFFHSPIALGKDPTSYSIGFTCKFWKHPSFHYFTPPCRAGTPLEILARERQWLKKPTTRARRQETSARDQRAES